MSDTPRIVLEVEDVPVKFEAHKTHIVAIFQVANNKTLGIRFVSPEHLLEFAMKLMDMAAITWPDHPFMQQYKEDQDHE